jgi:hypothetical protein
VDSPKDELGSGKQKEEIPQQEILADTLPPDEQKPKVELSEHTEEVQEPSLE